MRTYRQGTVLGLTVAEIFLLLVFLLLFLLLFKQILAEEERDGIKEELPPIIWKRPDEIETLEEARRALEGAEETLNELDEQRITAAVDAKRAKTALAQANQQRLELESALASSKQSEEAAKEQAQRESTLRRKGENPPCWYLVVPDPDSIYGTREKSYYAFNIAIYDESVELASREIPPGGAFDDGDRTFAEEWDLVGIDNLPYGERMSDAEFQSAVKTMVQMAESQQVRTYECIFFVQVWDRTSDDAKRRWQEAHDDLLEDRFGTYRVRENEWVPDVATTLQRVED